MDKSITSICRKCNKSAPSSEFRIDLEAGVMVCPACHRGKNKEPIKNVVTKDWDDIDERLEQRKRISRDTTEQVQEIGDTGKAKYTCKNCRFAFKYNVFSSKPSNCPYCNADVPKMKFA